MEGGAQIRSKSDFEVLPPVLCSTSTPPLFPFLCSCLRSSVLSGLGVTRRRRKTRDTERDGDEVRG